MPTSTERGLLRPCRAERLFKMWKRLNLSKDGIPYKYPSEEALKRTGVEGLPGVWCPPKPRSAARAPGRPDLRGWLGLLMEQKRIHCDELVRGYQHWATVGGVERPAPDALPPTDDVDPPLLKQHAVLVLKNLRCALARAGLGAASSAMLTRSVDG